MTALYIILSFIGVIILLVKSNKKWAALKDLDLLYYYGRRHNNASSIEDHYKLKFNFKRIKATNPPSESLKKIKNLILKSILELGITYSKDRNKEFVSSQYIEQSRIIRRQIDEYYRLMTNTKINKIDKIDALVLTVDSYKEACALLDKK